MKTNIPLMYFTFFLMIAFSTMLNGQNTLRFSAAETSVKAGSSQDVTVSYTQNTGATVYIQVRLIDPAGNVIEEQTESRLAASGSVTFTNGKSLIIPTTASGNGYRWNTQMHNSDWSSNLVQVDGADVRVTENDGSDGGSGNEMGDDGKGNSITFNDAPGVIEVGSPLTITMGYTNTTGSPVYVQVHLLDPTGRVVEETTKTGRATSGNLDFILEAPSGASGSGYKWHTQMYNSEWIKRLVNFNGRDVTVVSEPPGGNNNSLTISQLPQSISFGGDYNVTLDYAVEQRSRIYIQIFNKPNTDNGPWQKIAEGISNELTANTKGSTTVSGIDLNQYPGTNNRLVVLLFEVRPDDSWESEPINLGDISALIPGIPEALFFGEKDPSDPIGTRYYNRDDEGSFYNGGQSGPDSGSDHTLLPEDKVYRENFWVNNAWKGPIKAFYDDGPQNGKNFWVEWQNIGTVRSGSHAEFDIRVEKSTVSTTGANAGFPSKLGNWDINQEYNTTSTGKWSPGSSGRCQVNMTAWIYNSSNPNVSNNPNLATRCDIIVEQWNNSGDFKAKYKLPFRYPSPDPASNKITYFDHIGETNSNHGIVYDVLRTMPGGFGEGASYNLIPKDWSRYFNPGEFETTPIVANIDMNKILRDIVTLEAANGQEEIMGKDGTLLPTPQLPTLDWYVHVMEWTVTGQSGGNEHDPTSSNFHDKVYIPNSKGRFTYEQYNIPNPCDIDVTKNCPPDYLNAKFGKVSGAINSNEDLQDFRVAPNPFVSSFKYQYSVTANTDKVTVELYALSGRKVKTIKNARRHTFGNYTDSINISFLDSGMYMLRITSSAGTQIIKLIKN